MARYPLSQPSTRECPGIELEPGVYSGCHDVRCRSCDGRGRIGWWNAECGACWGRGYMNDCPVCADGRDPVRRPADFPGVPMARHPSAIYSRSFYSPALQAYIDRARQVLSSESRVRTDILT